MKSFLPLILFFLLFSFSVAAQYGLNSLGLGAIDYVEVSDDPDGFLDAGNGFTFEAWILNLGGPSNQKVAGKLVNDFQNGFIYGIENYQVNFEVFDQNGTNTNLLADSVSGIGWTHVAGSYEVGGMLTIFINGEKVGETAASATPVDFNLNPFRIGIAPWDVNALGFSGYIDEVRYWQAVLDEATIRSWMHKDVTPDHPDYNLLGLYHKYNEAEGPTVADETDNENDGVLSSSEIVFEDIFLPFKGVSSLLDNDVQGIWNAKTAGNSDIMSVTGFFFDPLELEVSVLFGHSDGDYSFDTDTPGDYDRSLSRIWQTITQGELLVEVSFDLSPVDMSQVTEVVLLSSQDEDFSDADVVDGELNGNTFTVEEFILEEEIYYTLGFKTTISSTQNIDQKDLGMKVFPNPFQTQTTLGFDLPEAGHVVLTIFDQKGQLVRVLYEGYLGAGDHQWQWDGTDSNGKNLPAGVYQVQVKMEDGVVNQKVVLQ